MEKSTEQALAAHFAPESVHWRIGSVSKDKTRATALAYLDARDIQDRLVQVLGCGGWAFDFTPLHFDGKGTVTSARGVITVDGVSKSDIGTASTYEPSKGAVSDSLKRAAIMWGVGRYLYALPEIWCQLDAKGGIPAAKLVQLRECLARLATKAAKATTTSAA